MGNRKYYCSIIDILVCLLLGFIYSLFPEYYSKGTCVITSNLIMKSILYFLLFLFATILTKYLFNKINKDKKENINSFFGLWNSKNKIYKYRLFIIAGLILIIWLPIIIGLFPGTLSNDTWGQYSEFHFFTHNFEQLSDHHPVFDTLFMGGLLSIFHKIFGNWQFSFFFYTIIQAIITSLVFAYSVLYAKEKLKLKNGLIIFMILIYSLLPIFPGIVQTINKDSLFSWIYVLFFIKYLEYIRSHGDSFSSKKEVVLFVIISIFCCLTKKIGFYVIFISLIFLLFFKNSNKKKILSTILILGILMLFIIPKCMNILNIKPGGEQEKYSLLFQQTARYIKYNNDDITKEERDIIEKVIGKDSKTIANVYDPTFADPVKGYTQMAESSEYKKYLIVWLKQGLRHPLTYIDGANCMLSGWMSFRMYKPLMNMDWHAQLDERLFNESVTIRTWNNNIANNIQNGYDFLYKIPIIKYLFTPGLYVSIIPLFSLITIMKKKKIRRYTLGLMPLFLSIILGCFLAPASDNIEGQRYLYPVIYTTIITIMWLFYCINNEEKKVIS